MKLGLNLYSLRNMIQNKEDFLWTARMLKENGYDFLQFSGSPLSLAAAQEVSEQSGMPILLTHSPYERIVNDTEALMEEHRALGCRYIGLGSMPGIAKASDEELLAMIGKLNEAGRRMQDKGFVFCYHNHWYEFRKLASGQPILDYMLEQAPFIHFIPDTYWIQYGGASITEYFEKMKGRMECVHLKDYRVDPESRQPDFTYLGNGAINFRSVIDTAVKCGAEHFFVEQDSAALLPDGLYQVIKSAKYIKENF